MKKLLAIFFLLIFFEINSAFSDIEGYRNLLLNYNASSYALSKSNGADNDNLDCSLNPTAILNSIDKKFIGAEVSNINDFYLATSIYSSSLFNAMSNNFSLRFDYLGTDDIEKTTITNPSSTSTYGYHNFLVSLIQAGNYKSMKYGIAYKVLYSTIDDKNSTVLLLDLGNEFKIDKINVGLTAKNLGIIIKKFDEKNDPLPINFNTFLNYEYKKFDLNLSFSFLPNSSDKYFSLGSTYKYTENFNMKLGYSSEYNDLDENSYKSDISNKLLGFTFGMGITWKNFKIDYAVVPFGDFGFNHKLGINYNY